MSLLGQVAAVIGAAQTPWEDLILQPGDIVLTNSRTLMGRMVKFFTRQRGEQATEANHAALVTTVGWLRDVLVIEAKVTVQEHNFWKAYAGRDVMVAIWRPRGLTVGQKATLVLRAQRYLGFPYGGLKLVPHALDWLIGGHYVFRRFARIDEYPICSWIVAYAYAALGRSFGVAANSASPDDIDDYVASHPDQYLCVLPWRYLRAWEWVKSPGEA